MEDQNPIRVRNKPFNFSSFSNIDEDQKIMLKSSACIFTVMVLCFALECAFSTHPGIVTFFIYPIAAFVFDGILARKNKIVLDNEKGITFANGKFFSGQYISVTVLCRIVLLPVLFVFWGFFLAFMLKYNILHVSSNAKGGEEIFSLLMAAMIFSMFFVNRALYFFSKMPRYLKLTEPTRIVSIEQQEHPKN